MLQESSVDTVFLEKGDDVEVSVLSDISQNFDVSGRKLSDISQNVNMVNRKLSDASDNVEECEVQDSYGVDRVWTSPDLITAPTVWKKQDIN